MKDTHGWRSVRFLSVATFHSLFFLSVVVTAAAVVVVIFFFSISALVRCLAQVVIMLVCWYAYR